jgi:hypothetical protein
MMATSKLAELFEPILREIHEAALAEEALWYERFIDPDPNCPHGLPRAHKQCIPCNLEWEKREKEWAESHCACVCGKIGCPSSNADDY